MLLDLEPLRQRESQEYYCTKKCLYVLGLLNRKILYVFGLFLVKFVVKNCLIDSIIVQKNVSKY